MRKYQNTPVFFICSHVDRNHADRLKVQSLLTTTFKLYSAGTRFAKGNPASLCGRAKGTFSCSTEKWITRLEWNQMLMVKMKKVICDRSKPRPNCRLRTESQSCFLQQHVLRQVHTNTPHECRKFGITWLAWNNWRVAERAHSEKLVPRHFPLSQNDCQMNLK